MFACGKSCEVFRTGVVSFLGTEMRTQNGNCCGAAFFFLIVSRMNGKLQCFFVWSFGDFL